MSDRRCPRQRVPRKQVRRAIAHEAAGAMYWEGVGQYLDAKRVAAQRILGRDGVGARVRHQDLPSNGEIREALLELARLAEGQDRSRRLFAMRVTALTVMEALEPFHPRLIGSVWSGHVRTGSDVDIHVFCDGEGLDRHLQELGWRTRDARVEICVGSEFRQYRHVHVLDQPFPVELSVYEVAERRTRTRSSTDGRPIDRVSSTRLRDRLADEHADAWNRYLTRGALELGDLAMPADAFAGLLAELSTECSAGS